MHSFAKNLYEKLNRQSPFLATLVRRWSKLKFGRRLTKKIRGRENHISIKSFNLDGVKIVIEGSGNSIDIEEGCFLRDLKITLRGDSQKVRIGRNVQVNVSGAFLLEGDETSLIIGDKTTFEETHLAVTEQKSRMTIGEDCMFSAGIEVRTGDSHSIIDEKTKTRINYAKDVVIGDHVWVGARVTILKGAEISGNSIIATGAIVSSEFPNRGVVIGGIPAKELKSAVNWDRRRL